MIIANLLTDEVRGVFLDISKAFDKVWHDGVIFKMEQNGIFGKLHKLLHDLLINRKRYHINDLPKGLSSNTKLFPDKHHYCP